MKLFKSPLRRSTAVLAGAFLGMAGAVALAAPASAHSPLVSGEASCVDAATGHWKIDWRFGNDFGTIAKVASIELDPQLELTGLITRPNAFIPANTDQHPRLAVPGETDVTDGAISSVTVKVKLYWPRDSYTNFEPVVATVSQPADCTPPSTPPSTPPTSPSTPPSEEPSTPPTEVPPTTPPTTEPPAPDEPTPLLNFTCTTLEIGLDNPTTGVPITLHYKTSKGEERDTTINPGEKKVDTFSATPGFTVTVSAPGLDDGSETIAYEKPADCATGTGGGLPVTGAAAGGIAGGAAALLAVGTGLFFMARRRKLKFTA